MTGMQESRTCSLLQLPEGDMWTESNSWTISIRYAGWTNVERN